MDTKTYAAQLERKLIEQFKESFYEKVGYYPVVVTRLNQNVEEYLPIMPLEALQEYFEPFLPYRNGMRLCLKSKDRYRELVELRNIYCFIARTMGYSLATVGQSIGNRDHTTVIHNVSSFKNLVETNETFQQKYIRIFNHIKKQHESSTMGVSDQVQRESEPALLS